jgi:uncharacterized membrane protein YphA (DoxX/SURF4 family)
MTRKGIHAGLWVAQILLALLFAGAGFAKAATPLGELAASLPYTADLPGMMVRFIGVSEVAGALGLLLPAATRLRPHLTPLAAAGLALVMVLATLFHLTRGEFSAMPMTAVLAALAGVVAWGRFAKVPIAPR